MPRAGGAVTVGMAAVLAVAIAGCVGNPAQGDTAPIESASPDANSSVATQSAVTASPSESLRPAFLTPSPPSSSPAPSMLPAPTPSPLPRPSPRSTAPASPAPFDAALEAMLPDSLDGIPLTKMSAPITNAMGGDICTLLCPNEPKRLSAASGVPVEDISMAIAVGGDGPGIRFLITAIRFPGLETSRLIPMRFEAGGHSAGDGEPWPAETTNVRVGSRTIVWATYPPWYNAFDNEYLYAHGDILFLISGLPPTKGGHAPEDVALAVKALP